MQVQKRIDNPEKIDRLLIEKELNEGKLIIVQFSGKLYSDEILAELNELCLAYDDNFNIRFYGHYQASFDCKILLKLPDVKALWLDCLCKVDNLEVIADLKNLTRLSLGIFELRETEVLKSDNFFNLKRLIIGETRTKALNLDYLENYTSLNQLVICGHTKNIDVVGKLINLEHLGLNSISKVRLDFVNKLKKLKSLFLVLGGRENLDEIEENEIESLEIVRVRGFNNFQNISNFRKLRKLLIEDQIQLTNIHFDQELPALNDLRLINCKSLKSLTGLDKLSKLNQLRINKTDIVFDEFIKQSFPKSLDVFAFYTRKARIDKGIKEQLSNLGYSERSF